MVVLGFVVWNGFFGFFELLVKRLFGCLFICICFVMCLMNRKVLSMNLMRMFFVRLWKMMMRKVVESIMVLF